MTRGLSLLSHIGNRQLKLCVYTRWLAKAAPYTSYLHAEHCEGISYGLKICGKYHVGVAVLTLIDRPLFCLG